MPIWFGVFLVGCLGAILAFYQLLIPLIILTCLLLFAVWIRPVIAARALAAVVVLVFFYVYSDWRIPPQPDFLPIIHQKTIVGKVASYPRYDGRTARFVLQTDQGGAYQGKIQVFCFFDPGLAKGYQVRLQGDLNPPSPPGNPGELDYPFYLRCQGIYYTMSIKEAGEVHVLSQPHGPTAWLVNYQAQAVDLVRKLLPEEDANILLGMLLGIVEGIDPEEYRDYQKTGIIHVFSVSGMHIGFLLLVSAWVTSIMQLKRSARLICGIVLLLVYGALTGWPPPVMRSSIMGGLGLVAYYSGRENSLLNSIGLAGLVIVAINPCAPLQISFQFTFLATWGLVYLFPLVKVRLAYRSRLWDLILIPVCAQLPMFPLLVYHFNLFSPVSIISNILLGYLSGIVVVLGFFALIFSGWFPMLAGLFLNPAGLLIEIIRGINAFLVKLPGAFFWVASPPWWTILVYYMGLLVLVYAMACKQRRNWLMAGSMFMSILVVVVFLPAGSYGRGTLEVTFVDVGQGDCILIKTAKGKFIMVDGGGSEFTDVAQRKLLPYLHHRGIREIWLMINTHPDTDHLQGQEVVLQEVRVRQMAIPECLSEVEQYDQLKQILTEKGIPLYKLAAGDNIDIEKGLEVKVLYPESDTNVVATNGQSLVLKIKYGLFSTLLTGDLRREELQSLSEAGLEPVTLLKVPHHGSQGSLLPALYDQTHPTRAVISVGANNRFGHPHHLVLEELERRRIKVYRTDLEGAVSVESDGQTFSTKTFR